MILISESTKHVVNEKYPLMHAVTVTKSNAIPLRYRGHHLTSLNQILSKKILKVVQKFEKTINMVHGCCVSWKKLFFKPS